MTLSLQGDRPRDTPKMTLSTCSARLLPIGLTVRFRALTVLEPCTLLALSGRSLERLVQPVLRATVHVETGQAAPPASAARCAHRPEGLAGVGGVGTLSTGPSRETGVEVCLLHVGMLRLGVHNVPGHAKGETLSAGVAGTRPQPGSALGPAHQFRLARE